MFTCMESLHPVYSAPGALKMPEWKMQKWKMQPCIFEHIAFSTPAFFGSDDLRYKMMGL